MPLQISKEMPHGLKIIVTGGAGFIGSHLCAALVHAENHVTCIDNLVTGSLGNIKNLMGDAHFTFVQHDVRKAYSLYADMIFNLACPASPPHYQRNPVATFMTSILGAQHALDNGLEWNARVFQASTSEVYGDPSVHPQNESYWGNVNPIGVRSCYDEGKRGAESLFFDYWRSKHSRIKVARIFNTYGPNMDAADGRVVSNFIMQALNGTDITIYGDGSQTRSFCYIDDLIGGIILLMMSEDAIIGPINIGNDTEFTIVELAEKVIKMTKSTSRIVLRKLPADDPRQRKPNLDKAKSQLGWQPEIQLEQGLSRTIEYFRKVK